MIRCLLVSVVLGCSAPASPPQLPSPSPPAVRAPPRPPTEPADYTAIETRPIENGGSHACSAFGAVEVTTPTECE